MKKLLLACCLLASTAQAETTQVRIPGKSWGIAFDMPALSQFEGRQQGAVFQYLAASAGQGGAPNTILSFFLEPDTSGSNKECFDTYWSKATGNPMIVKSSIRTASQPGYEQAFYKISMGQPHANFYFVHQGYCIDVHVSLTGDITGAEETLLAIGKSVKVFEVK
ncbi:MAG: hypothetical protein K0S16_2033 [Moraxellaceae bacterium]|jgi:hypothetical protein|nr:hypothetical protein [Moraxellaceae bacterium]